VKSAPAHSIQRVSFCTLAGVESVRLEGEEIVGRFASNPKPFYGMKGKRLFEEFANWPSDPAGVLRFTRRFGPLAEKPDAGSAFRFRCDAWRDDQEGFRLLWGLVQIEPPLPSTSSWGKRVGDVFDEVLRFDGAGGWHLVADPGDAWRYVNGALIYNAATLFRFVVLELLSVPHGRLRTCARPDCPHPHFVARHLNQNYCSEPCAAWGQSQWKRKWWGERGQEWRKRRTKRSQRKRR